MALGVHYKSVSRRAEGWGELDLILDFPMHDDLAATVAGSVTTAASECPATGFRRESSGAHTLADNRSHLFFVHAAQSPGS
jgi:hypothetical protein